MDSVGSNWTVVEKLLVLEGNGLLIQVGVLDGVATDDLFQHRDSQTRFVG